MSPILLVHGAWHGPWCWNAFAHRLRMSGHNVHTVQLSGHDGRPGRLRYGLGDYVEDLRRAAAQFDEPPVIVGHSLGGLLVQKHLERHAAAGVVLMASIPPGGALPVVLRFARRHPLVMVKVNLSLSVLPFTRPAGRVRELYFSPDTPQLIVEDCMEHLQNESYRMFLSALRLEWRPPRVPMPVLALGAEHDGLVTTGEVERTARAYGTVAEVFPGMGHDLMLDTGWENVADRVGAWVRQIAEASPPTGGGKYSAAD